MKDIKPIEDSADEVIKWYCIGAAIGFLIAISIIGFAFWLIS